jgi:hypothetical protein
MTSTEFFAKYNLENILLLEGNAMFKSDKKTNQIWKIPSDKPT